MQRFITPSKVCGLESGGSDSSYHGVPFYIQYSQQRDGDWVCCKCNNLNYSFRKKCNRCKTQTRELNYTPASVQSYYYYAGDHYAGDNQGEISGGRQQFEISGKQKDLEEFPHPSAVERIGQSEKAHVQTDTKRFLENTPPKKVKKSTDNQFRTPELPSVSPLLKKYYEARDKNIRTTIGDRKLKRTFTELHNSYGKGSIFQAFEVLDQSSDKQHEKAWKNIAVRDFNEIMMEEENEKVDQLQYPSFPGQEDQVQDQLQKLIESLIIE